MPKLPTRGETGKAAPPAKAAKGRPAPQREKAEDDSVLWAEEDLEPKKNKFGAVGIIAVALALMVVVYIVATLLMK